MRSCALCNTREEVIVPVEITLLPETGGALASGYRATCKFEGILSSDLFGIELKLANRPRLEPGETARGSLYLWADNALPESIPTGTTFSINEGHKMVGTGIVIRELSPPTETR